jgi:mannose-1-phosphate guanylyltransferase
MEHQTSHHEHGALAEIGRENRPGKHQRAAIILAGGDGTRLSGLTRRITGSPVPKQFCALLGEATLLQMTRNRVALSIPPELTMFALNREHASFFSPLLTDVAPENLVQQPQNRGTAPAILYSLLRLAELAPGASVLLMPSDHHVGDEAALMNHVNLAFATVEERPELTVLLGVVPNAPETAYGWIEPGRALGVTQSKVCEVRRFWEKPSREIAVELMASGCLWNSFVILGRLSTLLGLFMVTMPELYTSFLKIGQTLGSQFEEGALRKLYRDLHPADFSRQVLEPMPMNLAVLPVADAGWSDLGEPERVRQALATLELRPPRMKTAPALASGRARGQQAVRPRQSEVQR